MMDATSGFWVLVTVICLHPTLRAAFPLDCQVQCPEGMMCIRTEGSNLHLCIPINIRLLGNSSTEDYYTDQTLDDVIDSRCPSHPFPSGPCMEQCRYHSDCARGTLCCGNDCGGRTCIPTTPHAVSKPGSCPLPERTESEPCVRQCQGDGECPSQHKCCRSRCGMTCRAPCFHWLAASRTLRPWRLSRRCQPRHHRLAALRMPLRYP